MLWKRIAVAAVVGLGLLGAGFWVGGARAATGEPGSAADPLVTKSYVDEVLAALPQPKTLFEVVRVSKDAVLLGESGTEIVLRGGKATAIVSAKGGVLDATAGVDLVQGEAIKPNHLLIIPVSDGRGLTAQTDLILIVKGPYSIKTSGQ